MVEAMDEAWVKFSALDKAGVAENTMSLFTSDNGGLSTSEEARPATFLFAEAKVGFMRENSGTMDYPIPRCDQAGDQ